MLKERKIDGWFYVEGRIRGERIRLALRTQNRDNASDTIREISNAFAEGTSSTYWPKLKNVLPEKTFRCIAAVAGYKETPSIPAPTWKGLVETFKADFKRRIALGERSASTLERYDFEFQEFSDFLTERGIELLATIDRQTVEQYKVWRMERIRKRSKFTEAKSLVLTAAILHRVFSFAVNESEVLVKNPVRLEGRPGEKPERGSQPFKPDEIQKLRENAGPYALTVALLRWTGLRGSDAVLLTWSEVDFDTKEIGRMTQKRKKRVVVPIHPELLFALEVERDKRNPPPWERVLLNPETGRPFTRPRLYERMMALGRQSGVANSNPHRFRDSLAVEMLCRGATPYDVAKVLGDTIETVEQHYAPFVPELRERVRRIMELGPETEKIGRDSGRIWAGSASKNKQLQ